MKLGTLDRYSMQARLSPALLAISPVAIGTVVTLPGVVDVWQSVIGGLIVACGGMFLLAEIGRDRGKALEPNLFQDWGGKPTTQLLSYEWGESQDTVDRMHRRLEALFPSMDLPSPQQESESPDSARDLYEEAVARLRTLTRDQEKFPLVFKENVSYGFRRNLLGLKPIGLPLAVLGGLASLLFLLKPELQPGQPSVERQLTSFAICTGLAIVWLTQVRPSWVRVPAMEYAHRLLESVTKLENCRSC